MIPGRAAPSDVAVVGASVAGLYLAALLADWGARVRVFERKDGLDPVPRTLILTGGVRRLLGSVAEAAAVHRISRFELVAGATVTTVAVADPDLVVERAALVRELARRAQEAGVEIATGRRFIGLAPDGGALRIDLARGRGGAESHRAAAVVGADGAFRPVARAAGWGEQPTVPVIQALVALPDDLPPDTVRVWFRPEQTPFFFWLVPSSPARGALGVIGRRGQEARDLLDSFLEEREITPAGYQAARIPLYRRWTPVRRMLGGAPVYLVGDAAGHVKATTLGGIVPGLRGARAVARAIRDGRAGGELRRLRRELDTHRLLLRGVARFTSADYARLLSLLRGAGAQVLGGVSRDDAGRLVGRLLLAEPRIGLLALRGLTA